MVARSTMPYISNLQKSFKSKSNEVIQLLLDDRAVFRSTRSYQSIGEYWGKSVRSHTPLKQFTPRLNEDDMRISDHIAPKLTKIYNPYSRSLIKIAPNSEIKINRK